MKTGKTLIAIIQYRPLTHLPPLLSLLLTLKRLDVDFVYIGAESVKAKEFLEEHAIAYRFLPYNISYYYPKKRPSALRRLIIKFRRALEFYPKRRILLRMLNDMKAEYDFVIPWFQESLSAALAGNNLMRKFPAYALTLYELSDRVGARWLGYNFEKALRGAVVVSAEVNRAWILQAMYRLHMLPLVIANKPIMHPRLRNQPLPECAANVFEKIGSRPVFLYQGELHSDRRDVLQVLEIIAQERPQYCVVVMPGNEVAEKHLANYPNAFLLPRIVAPGHLAVTSRATVGLAFYNGTGAGLSYLNAIYCAPNKIYEYAGFGIPTLGNKIPGLEYSIGIARAGLCCELNRDSILRAADELVNRSDYYGDNAKRFFEDTDVDSQVRAVIHALMVRADVIGKELL